jgi:hypothetical protein
MKINNTTQIRADDFQDDDKQMADQLGNILNPFMQQVVELSDGRIDFENRVENFRQVEFTVDAAGVPTLNDTLSTGKASVRGFQVVAAYGSDNALIGATSQPFINFSPLASGSVKVLSITGLPANVKMTLNVVIY